EGKLSRRISVGRMAINRMECSPDGKQVLLRTIQGEIASLWDIESGKEVTSSECSQAFRFGDRFAYSPDGNLIAMLTNVGGTTPRSESGVVVWDFTAKKVRFHWKWQQERIRLTSAVFSPDSKVLAVGTSKGEMRLYQIGD